MLSGLLTYDLFTLTFCWRAREVTAPSTPTQTSVDCRIALDYAEHRQPRIGWVFDVEPFRFVGTGHTRKAGSPGREVPLALHSSQAAVQTNVAAVTSLAELADLTSLPLAVFLEYSGGKRTKSKPKWGRALGVSIEDCK